MPSALYDQQRREYQELLEDYRRIAKENLELRRAISQVYHSIKRGYPIAFQVVEEVIKGEWLEY